MTDNTQIFIVGGNVRDYYLNRTSDDVDYVVVGATHDYMLSLGMKQVGADFPVYLNVEGVEYAMARREKKTGDGYNGFTCEFGPDVTLEEDLARRDLTINAMAHSSEHVLHDPYGGMDDLQHKVLRHTSNAFEEDPVRVLRLARFRARFGSDWTVAPETVTLVSQMSKKGVLSELTAERVWKELSRALMEPFPRLFFDTLLECDALHTLFPEVYALCSAMEARRWHPEGNAYEHTMLVLTQAARNDYDLETRYACLVHDFGKGLTRKEHMPKHYGHDVNGVPVVKNFNKRLTVPAKMGERAAHATRYHMAMHNLDVMGPKGYVKMFTDMKSFNDPAVVDLLYRVGVCDARGRLGSENCDVNDLVKVRDVFDLVRGVKFDNVFPSGCTNVNVIKDGMYRARMNAVKGNV